MSVVRRLGLVLILAAISIFVGVVVGTAVRLMIGGGIQ